MGKFCGKCGTRLDERTGLCPQCDAKALRNSKRSKVWIAAIALLAVMVGLWGIYTVYTNWNHVLQPKEPASIEALDTVPNLPEKEKYLTSVVLRDSQDQSVTKTIRFAYNDSNLVSRIDTIQDVFCFVTEIYYDEEGRIIEQWSNGGGVEIYQYNAEGQLVGYETLAKETEEERYKYKYTYDAHGNLATVTGWMGSASEDQASVWFYNANYTYTYNAQGQKIRCKYHTKYYDGTAYDDEEIYHYNDAGELIGMELNMQEGEKYQYRYDWNPFVACISQNGRWSSLTLKDSHGRSLWEFKGMLDPDNLQYKLDEDGYLVELEEYSMTLSFFYDEDPQQSQEEADRGYQDAYRSLLRDAQKQYGSDFVGTLHRLDEDDIPELVVCYLAMLGPRNEPWVVCDLYTYQNGEARPLFEKEKLCLQAPGHSGGYALDDADGIAWLVTRNEESTTSEEENGYFSKDGVLKWFSAYSGILDFNTYSYHYDYLQDGNKISSLADSFQGDENGESLDINKYLTLEEYLQSLEWMDLGSGMTIEELFAELNDHSGGM